MQILLREQQTHDDCPTKRRYSVLNAKSRIRSLTNQTENRKDYRRRSAGWGWCLGRRWCWRAWRIYRSDNARRVNYPGKRRDSQDHCNDRHGARSA